MRTSIEVADIFRSAGPAYRAAHEGHLSLAQLKVMSAIEHCRTAALGGHVEACEDCGQWRIAYNSCRNRHCPKCQISSRAAFLLPVRVLGKLFRRLFLTRLLQLHDAGRLAFFGSAAHLADRRAFVRHLSPVRKTRWVVYAKPPFAGPEAVLAYLSRYTHRVAISNSRLISFDQSGVTFRYKDYRRDGADRQQIMTLTTDEFIRRFLLHVLPRGFHRIRHYGLLAGGSRTSSIARARELLNVAAPPCHDAADEQTDFRPSCPCCGGRMIIIDVFERWRQPRGPPDTAATNRENAS